MAAPRDGDTYLITNSTSAGCIVANDQSMVQVGHNYHTNNIYHCHADPTEHLLPESSLNSSTPSQRGESDLTPQQRRRQIINSLRFDHIENRYSNIKPAHPKTCKWLLTNGGYKSWLDKTRVSEHHGILWLKGKPGAGKSTIIKFIFSEAQSWGEQDIPIAFFFNARGSLLEKSALGMYRSLLFQLFQKHPNVPSVFDNVNILELPASLSSPWTIPQLQILLHKAIRQLGTCRLWVYVDALDECDEDQIRAMVAFFSSLGKDAITTGIHMRIFFASRHYPRITIANKVELVLEDELGHSHDIENYIYNELRATSDIPEPAVVAIREKVKQRAFGVFIWAVLVVQILNKELDRGRISLEKKLNEIPNDLGELFRGILTRDSEDMEDMRLCIQWVLFAKRPLRREELYFAIVYGTDPEQAESWEKDLITSTAVIDARILSCSKGLIERASSTGATMQFIHETVRDFFLKQDGMQHIQGRPFESLLGYGHDTLKQSCMDCISLTQSRHRNLQHSLRLSGLRRPFIEYALSHVLFHADVAECNGVSQASLLKGFPTTAWIGLQSLLGMETVHSSGSSLLSILAEENLSSLIKAMLQDNPQLGIADGLWVALAKQRDDALCALLAPAANPNSYISPEIITKFYKTYLHGGTQRGLPDSSILHHVFIWGTEIEFSTLLGTGRFDLNTNVSTKIRCSPLSAAVERGYDGLVEFLLLQHGVDANLQDDRGRTPLSKAAKEGRWNIVRLLLQHDIDVNLRSHDGRSPISYASEGGHEHVVRLLLAQPDVDADQRDENGRTPFFHAAKRGKEEIVKLLIASDRVDILSQDNFGQTPLSYAGSFGHTIVITHILNSSHNTDDTLKCINSRDNVHGRTPLSIAAGYGYGDVVDLLLCAGADANIPDFKGLAPLDWARLNKHWEIGEMIVRRTA